jgi:hypothetical protein
MKLLYRFSADVIWITHFLVVFIALFGWLIPSIQALYLAVLIGTLISTLALGYCVLSKWEYDLRKAIEPDVQYDFTYASYYTYRLTHGYLSNSFLKWAGVVFVSLSLAINLYFR